MYFNTMGATLLAAGVASTLFLGSAHAAEPNASPDPVEHLEPLIVTGLLDSKTRFDVAQGASLLDEKELLLRRQSSLGETLSALPGVASTYFGPGASRPIIRGLGGDRVRMLNGGIGSQDLSNISPDHAVTIEPGLVDRIEVLRGPTTLLYGNSAVGGVVNVVDGKVPVEKRPWAGVAEGRWDSVSDGATGLIRLYGTTGGMGVAVSGLRSISNDLHIPGNSRIGGEGPSGRLDGSSTERSLGSFGLGWIGERFAAGASASLFETTYGVPGDEPIEIDLHQHKFDGESRVRIDSDWFSTLTFKGGISRYEHAERDRNTGEVHTTFRQRGGEGRLELKQTRRGSWTGISGIQFSATRMSSEGEEVVIPAVRQGNIAAFSLQEVEVGSLSLQAGGRAEHQTLEILSFSPDIPVVPGYKAAEGDRRANTSASFATGAVWRVTSEDSIALSATASQRLPTAQELYSNGPHGGTGSYEVGRSDLSAEKAFGVDLTYRRHGRAVTSSIGVFVHQFRNFIYEDHLGTGVVTEADEEGLPVYQYAASNARFQGAEAEVTIHLIDTPHRTLHWSNQADFVRATNLTRHEPLPRIPPGRLRTELRYGQNGWEAAISTQYVVRQDQVPEGETETAGYALLDLEVTKQWRLTRGSLISFLRVQNALDRNARVHTSFLKNVAPLPGRNLTAGLRYEF